MKDAVSRSGGAVPALELPREYAEARPGGSPTVSGVCAPRITSPGCAGRPGRPAAAAGAAHSDEE